jgi:hypothetical protein
MIAKQLHRLLFQSNFARIACGTVLGAVAFTSSASATITASLVLGPQPTPEAKADAPVLANYTTYDLRVTLTGSYPDTDTQGNPVTHGDDWQSAQVYFKLTSGSFYNSAAADSKKPQPNIWTIPSLRNLKFDTWIAGYNDGSDNPSNYVDPTILGAFIPSDPNNTGAGSEVFIANETNVSWVDLTLNPNPIGGALTFTIARFTVSNGATGFITGRAYSYGDPFVGADIVSTIPTITPEPASLGLLVIGAGAMLRRPKRRVARA